MEPCTYCMQTGKEWGQNTQDIQSNNKVILNWW